MEKNENHGKDICQYLKEMRERVARENDIPYETHECHYEGPCKGTCPRCEAEAKYLESELSRRSRLGKAASVAGMALSMAAFTSCFQTVGEEEMPDEVMGLDPYEDSTQCEQAPEQASAAESAVEYDAEQLNINE